MQHNGCFQACAQSADLHSVMQIMCHSPFTRAACRGLAPLEVQAARDSLADISSLASVHKRAARCELLLSRTFPMALPPACIHYRPDVLGSSPAPGVAGPVMTDGCGYISYDLAAAVPLVAHGRYQGPPGNWLMPIQVSSPAGMSAAMSVLCCSLIMCIPVRPTVCCVAPNADGPCAAHWP